MQRVEVAERRRERECDEGTRGRPNKEGQHYSVNGGGDCGTGLSRAPVER
jgi:hypothetical protein